MKRARLPVRLAVGAALSAIAAIPSGAYAACSPATSGSSSPPAKAHQNQAYNAVDQNGAGLPVNENGTVIPGVTLGGTASTHDSTANKAQGAADDRDPQSKAPQAQTGNTQVAKGPSGAACD